MINLINKIVVIALLFITTNGWGQQIFNQKKLSDGWHKVYLEGGLFYDGEIIMGKLEGKGVMTYPDSSSYSGTWKVICDMVKAP